jgi:hypothetical protein
MVGFSSTKTFENSSHQQLYIDSSRITDVLTHSQGQRSNFFTSGPMNSAKTRTMCNVIDSVLFLVFWFVMAKCTGIFVFQFFAADDERETHE